MAVGYASNAVGTINPVAEITRLAHAAGALVFVDAVQYAPHGPIDVQALGCDFLACSAYKFFGPHVGILYGRYELLDQLDAYKVRPAPALPPEKYETGTQNHEGIAGTLGALEYFEWLGQAYGEDDPAAPDGLTGRRLAYKRAMRAVQAVEMELSRALIEELQAVPGLRMYGITDLNCLDQRVPTVSFTLPGHTPRQIAEHLAAAGINVWAGNFYALALAERLGLQGQRRDAARRRDPLQHARRDPPAGRGRPQAGQQIESLPSQGLYTWSSPGCCYPTQIHDYFRRSGSECTQLRYKSVQNCLMCSKTVQSQMNRQVSASWCRSGGAQRGLPQTVIGSTHNPI